MTRREKIIAEQIARCARLLRHAREFAGLSVFELAARADVSAEMLKLYERGVRYPNTAVLARIATALDILPSELLA